MAQHIEPSLWKSALRDMAECNACVSLCGLLGVSGEACGLTHQVRVLAVNAAGIVFDRPERMDVGVYFTPGTRIRVLIAHRNQDWEFQTAVHELQQYELSERMAVRAMTLHWPQTVRTAQKRSYFRVNISGIQLLPVSITPIIEQEDSGLVFVSGDEAANPSVIGHIHAHDEGDHAAVRVARAPAKVQTVHARLQNLSGGGMGVVLPQKFSRVVMSAERFNCVLTLPQLPKALVVQARVVQNLLQDDGTLYLGLAFDFTDAVQRRRSGDMICRFTTWYQRQQAQLQREKP